MPERSPAQEDDALGEARASTLFVGSLEKGLQILTVFDRERRSMGLSEIVEASGLDKSSVQRFTFTLNALGFLRKDPASRKYALSPRILELGFAYLQTDSLLDYATPLLYEANQRCGESLNITELVGTEIVYVARAPSRHVISVDIFLGMRVPAYASAPGRAMLAFLDGAAAAAILDRSDLRKFTPRTVASRSGIMRELRKARAQGYALAEEQCYPGEISVAAPIFDERGEPVAALNASVPTSRWSAEAVCETLLPVIIETAAAISRGRGSERAHPWADQRLARGRGAVPSGKRRAAAPRPASQRFST